MRFSRTGIVSAVWIFLVAFLPAAVAIGAPRSGAAIVVNWDGTGDYLTIQEALDASTNGDSIVVYPSDGSPNGAYVENIIFPIWPVTLTSTDPLDPAVVAATIIDGDDYGIVVTFGSHTTLSSVMDGFTIQNGFGIEGGGIYCDYGSPTIRHCTITSNNASYGGGILLLSSNAAIEYCTISNNNADEGAGVSNWYGDPTLLGCTISGNYAYVSG